MEVKQGILYLCPTPIGNLEDITLRALRILKEVDLIAAESIARTRKLLGFYDIHTRLVSYREEDREASGLFLVNCLKKGKSIALVSDAGMPGFSDPGIHLINLCYKENIVVAGLPGPSVILTALVLSGFSTSRFVFEGFLPRKKEKRTAILKALSKDGRTSVLFEAPHRIEKTLQELSVYSGDRRLCVLRELTKKFEERICGSPGEILSTLTHNGVKVKGEITIVIEGSRDIPLADGTPPGVTIEAQLECYLREGYGLKEAAHKVAKAAGMQKRDVYQIGLHIKGKK